MFIEPSELKSAIYGYQIDEITESDDDIIVMAIEAAVQEMTSYLNPSNQRQWHDGRARYDTTAIFSATGISRNALILELCKSIAVWYACRLSNVDVIYDHIRERYDRAIQWLEKATGTGDYAGKPVINPGLPVVTLQEEDTIPWRMGSRQKFTHDID